MDLQDDKVRFSHTDYIQQQQVDGITGRWKTINLKGLVVNLLLFTSSIFFTLLIAEGLMRIVFHESLDLDMEMWKYATQIKIINENQEARYDHQLKRTAHLMGVDVETNSHGLRGIEVNLEKPENIFRIVVIGDSITFGWGVPQEKTFPAQLERLLNEQPPSSFPQGVKYEVLNLGVGNYNTTQEIARLNDLGLKFDPDMILLGYFINDAEPTPQPKTGFLIENSYLFAFGASRFRRLPILKGEIPLTYYDYYRSLYVEEQPGWQSTKAALARFVEIGKEHQIPVMMVIIPEIHDLSDDYPFANIHAQLELVGKEISLQLIDLFPRFQGYTPEKALWVSPTDAHHNSVAQMIIAQGIMDALAQNEIGLLINKEDSQ